MNNQSMRGFLAALEASGDLHRVTRAVDARFEIASVLALREHGPAQLFERVGSQEMPVVGNLLNSRARFARALGVARNDLRGFCLTALRNPLPPMMTEQGPVQDVVHRADIDLAQRTLQKDLRAAIAHPERLRYCGDGCAANPQRQCIAFAFMSGGADCARAPIRHR